MNQQRYAFTLQNGAASRVRSGLYEEMPTYNALPCRTACTSAPIVSSSGTSIVGRCE